MTDTIETLETGKLFTSHGLAPEGQRDVLAETIFLHFSSDVDRATIGLGSYYQFIEHGATPKQAYVAVARGMNIPATLYLKTEELAKYD